MRRIALQDRGVDARRSVVPVKIGRYSRDGQLVETREVPEFDTALVGTQTMAIEPPLVCEKGDYLAQIGSDGHLKVMPADGATITSAAKLG